jgi:amidohydrolase
MSVTSSDASAADLGAVKAQLCDEVDRRAAEIVRVSRALHANPELGFAEEFAHGLLAGAIESEGLAVQRSAHGLATAFVAEAGTTGPTVAVVCEYDALPGLGHACGHNIIGAAGLGAGLAAAALADRLGGRVRIIGTPAEEGGGGKVYLLEAGAFDGCDAALMVHPAGVELTELRAISVQQVIARYRGAAAHAAAAPHKGRNALDAAVLGYMNLAALRQHIRDDERLHGVFTDGGDKPNIVPSFASTHWYVRARDLARLDELRPRVEAALRAGADATGCEVELSWLDPAYADLVTNRPLVERYCANARVLGRHPQEPDEDTAVTGSTDMGNVSHVVPTIHPMIAVAPSDVAIHTEAFATHAGAEAGDRAAVDGAKMMAMTVADLWLDASFLAEVHAAFADAD